MQRNTINNKTMQRSNLARVLWTIYESGGISRRDVAARTGLTPSSVTNIVYRLMEDGLVREDAGSRGESAPVGRRPIRLTICGERYAVVGVELSADRITAVVTDFTGTPLAVGNDENSGANPPEVAVEKIRLLVDSLLRQSGVSRDRVLGLGLMSSGPYDREKGRMLCPTNFDGWIDVPICDMTAEALELPVFFDRDSVGCALDAQAAEAVSGALFAILVNTIGIGGALLIDGEVYYGLNNCASEIGCMTVMPDGPRCRCGDRGCLEAISSADALLNYIRERIAAGAPDPFDGAADRADAAMLAAAYRAGKPLAVEAVQRGARYLGIAIGNIIKVACPNVIALGGSFLVIFPEYYDLIIAEALDRRQERPKFIPFAHGPIQCALGGVQLVINRYFKALEQRWETSVFRNSFEAGRVSS